MVKEQGQGIRVTAKNLGLNEAMLARWIREYQRKSDQAFPGNGVPSGDQKKIQDLEQQVKRLSMERDILKKAMAYFVEPRK